jgi:hypothetical protein
VLVRFPEGAGNFSVFRNIHTDFAGHKLLSEGAFVNGWAVSCVIGSMKKSLKAVDMAFVK